MNPDIVEVVARAISNVINSDGESWGLYMSRQETLDLAQAALTAAWPAIMAWQPIGTAPRDGTAFVGSNGKYAYRTKLGQYYIKWPHEDGGPTYREEWNAEDSGSIWPWKPTHWQPLPAPPVKP